MSLSEDDIRRIADLGRIDITDEQVLAMQGELNDIFRMIEKSARSTPRASLRCPIPTTACNACAPTR